MSRSLPEPRRSAPLAPWWVGPARVAPRRPPKGPIRSREPIRALQVSRLQRHDDVGRECSFTRLYHDDQHPDPDPHPQRRNTATGWSAPMVGSSRSARPSSTGRRGRWRSSGRWSGSRLRPMTAATGSWPPTAGSSRSATRAFTAPSPDWALLPAGSTNPKRLNAPIVGMVPSADGAGYFMVASDGGVFAFGDAKFEGSCPGIGGCSGAAVAVMPDASGNGYWLVTATGHVYAFGDAVNYGAPGPQAVPVTAAVRTKDGGGLLASLRQRCGRSLRRRRESRGSGRRGGGPEPRQRHLHDIGRWRLLGRTRPTGPCTPTGTPPTTGAWQVSTSTARSSRQRVGEKGS